MPQSGEVEYEECLKRSQHQKTSNLSEYSIKMNKFFVIAVLVVTLFQCRAIEPFAGITRLKSTVKLVSNNLEWYPNFVISQTKMKLNRLRFNQMENVNTATNKALDDTRNDITAAKKKGKDADHCYESTRLLLRDASTTVFDKLNKCVDNEVALWNPVKNNIDAHITRGKLLLSELDSIALSCISGNHMQTLLCVAQTMPAASASVNNYKATAEQLKSTIDSLSGAAPIPVTRCFNQPMSDLSSSTSAARISASKCISSSSVNLPEKLPADAIVH